MIALYLLYSQLQFKLVIIMTIESDLGISPFGKKCIVE